MLVELIVVEQRYQAVLAVEVWLLEACRGNPDWGPRRLLHEAVRARRDNAKEVRRKRPPARRARAGHNGHRCVTHQAKPTRNTSGEPPQGHYATV